MSISNLSLFSKFSSSSSSTLAQAYQKIADNPSVQGLQTEASKRLSGLKNWSDFFEYARFKKPTDYSSFKNRFDFNIKYVAHCGGDILS